MPQEMYRIIPNDHKLHKLFKESVWVVPSTTLLAYKTINDAHTAVQDQTIWLIDKYTDGYIFGKAYTLIDREPLSQTTIIGSISPLGDVLMSFSNANTITSGQGKFIEQDGNWHFLMQMNTLNSISSGVIGLSHWSYMINITHTDCKLYNLPGTGMSIADFIQMFNRKPYQFYFLCYLFNHFLFISCTTW
jgi:hypothetical protein